MADIKVTDILFAKKEPRPVIINFGNGKLKSENVSKLETRMYRNKENEGMVAAATDRMLYSGKVNSNTLCNNYIVIHNKETDEVKLVTVDTATLDPYFPKSNTSDVSKVSYEKAMSALNKEFGSKRIKRQTEQKERLKTNIENVQEQLEKTVANVTVDESFLESSHVNENENSYRPPINRDASTKENVYKLDDLLPQKILILFEKEVEDLTNLDNHDLTPFVKNQIDAILNRNASNSTLKCSILLYVNYLLKLLATPAKHLGRRVTVCQFSNEVNNFIMDNFTMLSGNHRTRPLTMRDKSVCYVLVLSMIALEYQMNLEQLAKDANLGIKKMQEISRVLGFTTSGTDIVLKIPVPPPVVNSQKRKKK